MDEDKFRPRCKTAHKRLSITVTSRKLQSVVPINVLMRKTLRMSHAELTARSDGRNAATTHKSTFNSQLGFKNQHQKNWCHSGNYSCWDGISSWPRVIYPWLTHAGFLGFWKRLSSQILTIASDSTGVGVHQSAELRRCMLTGASRTARLRNRSLKVSKVRMIVVTGRELFRHHPNAMSEVRTALKKQ